MTINKLVLACIMVSAVLMPGVGVAQDSQQQSADNADQANAQQQQPSDPNKNWLKVCEPIDGGDKACIMRQVVVQNGQFIGSFVLRNDPGQESRLFAVAAVPVGVLLPFQMYWQIDGSDPVRVPYVLCDPASCQAQTAVNEGFVNQLKKGAELTLTAKNRQMRDLVVHINLGGFTSVYDSDTAMTFEEYNKRSTGQQALEQVLQDRAEQLRREMGVSGDGTDSSSGGSDSGSTDSSTQ